MFEFHCEFGPFECEKCSRQLRLSKIKLGNPQPFYIVVYGITRCYGGPEEGGWWWDYICILQIKRIWTIKDALVSIKNLKEQYPQPKYNRFSVLGGQDIEIILYSKLIFAKEVLSTEPFQ